MDSTALNDLILTIVHQANTIREMAAEIARLRRLVAPPPEPQAAQPKPPERTAP